MTAVVGGYSNSTLSVWDRLTGTHFLVDSGADVCVFPVPTPNKRQPPSGRLTAANGSKINTWGLHKLTLNFGNKRTYKQDFYFADVTRPILGANFFATNNVAIDLRGRRLIDLNYCTSFLADVEKESITFCGLTLNSASQFDRLLLKFPDILVPKFQATVNKHGVERTLSRMGTLPLHVHDVYQPISFQLPRMNLRKWKKPALFVDQTPWSSPLHIVPKQSGGWRPCCDYRRLNAATTDDRYPLSYIQDFNSRLAGSRIFSKIDLIRGYHQIPMASDSIAKTAVSTPFGLWEFLRMSFGLKNAAQTFQRLMDGVFQNLDFAFVYLDDILVASKSESQHRDHLKTIFELLSANG